MADFDELHRVIHSIASGFEEECIRCMEEHKNVLVDCIQEQLYSGLDGTEHLLNPDYDTPILTSPVPGRTVRNNINDGRRG